MLSNIQLAKRAQAKQDVIDNIFQQIPFINQKRKRENLEPIINLCVGEPHLGINPVILKKLSQFLLHVDAKISFSYSPLEGRLKTREAITHLYKNYYSKVNYNIDEVMVCNGATQGLYNAFSLLVDSGTTVLAFEPSYSTYQIQVEQLGGEFIKISTIENGFRPSGKLLKQAFENYPQAKILILNYPNNPSGIDLSYAEIREITEVLQQYPNVVIVCDDVYRELSASEHYTVLDADPSLKDRCIMINSASKGLIGAPDMRVGIVGANAAFITAMTQLQANAVSSIGLFSQLALIEAIKCKLTDDLNYLNWLEQSKAAYMQNIEFISSQLKILGFNTVYGGNGFFILSAAKFLIGQDIPDVSIRTLVGHQQFQSDVDITLYLLHIAGVAVIPGSAFGIDEKLGYLRISCAKDEDELKIALLRLQQAIKLPS